MPFHNPLVILAILCTNIVLAEWLARKRGFKHFGAALIVILITAVTANLKIIPANLEQAPVYDGIFSYVAPLAIFYLLLTINLRDIKKAGLPMIGMFLLGAAGTMVGALVGIWLIDGPRAFGADYPAIAGMFVATYTGGSVNFNAIALHYGVAKNGLLYAGAVAVDNIITTLWMIATLGLPKLLQIFIKPRHATAYAPVQISETTPELNHDTETVNPMNLGVMLAAGLVALALSDWIAAGLQTIGIKMPSIIVLSTIALGLAQIRWVNRLRGSRVLGLFMVYLFLAVIGAFCDLSALSGLEQLGLSFLAFTTTIVLVHGLIIFGVAALLRLDWDLVAVASQANIGGPPSALAVAESLQREDLLLPAILVGALGYGMGTYLGFFVSGWVL
ncbi:MAG: DUF819 family protein [Calditrichaeota bacterium]|nr:MAG: DUF819 family protein [Calditrichota bacterium]